MTVIKVNKIFHEEHLHSALMPVIDVIDKINKSCDNDITLDFQNAKFFKPLFVLPLMMYLKTCEKNITLTNAPSSYLHTVRFNDEFKPEQMRHPEFEAHMQRYASKTYIPVVGFLASKLYDDEKSAITSTLEKIIIRQLNLSTNIVNGLKYMISEMVDNITEHSESERGYIFAQTYPTKGYLDVCIADNGITLLGGYKKIPDNEILSDLEAMQAANRGISTKNYPNAENRGHGIISSKNMLINGLGGSFVMISGNTVLLKSPRQDKFVELPQNIHWKGTIIALRIPYINQTFQYTQYI